MARIRPRPETGRLYFDFVYRGHRCREQTTLPDTPANRKRMEQVLQKIDAEITLGTFDYAKYFPDGKHAGRFATSAPPPARTVGTSALPSPSVKAFAELHYAEQSVAWRENTKLWMRSLYDTHILPVLGDRTLSEVTREDILAFRMNLANKRSKTGRALSAKTINSVLRVLSSLFAEAADRYGFLSPTARVKRLKVPRSDIQPFTLRDVQTLLATVRQDYYAYLLTRFLTGMRSGEIDGLKWQHVDLERRLILVRETYTHGRTDYTKTDGSQRDIAMSQPVHEALTEQEKATCSISEYVFCSRSGTPIDSKNFTSRVWYPLLRHLDLRPRRPYQTRHTCATLWLAAGENPEWIARQLGHTTTEMLFKTYSRFVPNLTRQDGSAMERVLSATPLPKKGEGK